MSHNPTITAPRKTPAKSPRVPRLTVTHVFAETPDRERVLGGAKVLIQALREGAARSAEQKRAA